MKKKQPIRILVADDDEAVRKLLKYQLESDGYEVILTTRGNKALSVLRRNDDIQLAILDWDMPGMDGIKLCRRVPFLGRMIYVMMVTTHTGGANAAIALDAGAHDFIAKPWNKEELLARIRVGCRMVSMKDKMQIQVAALKATANAIVITDREGCIEWVNPAFTTMTGYSAREAIGENPRMLKSERRDEAFYQELWKTITTGQVWQGEMLNVRKDGTSYTEEMTITPVRQGRRITHFIAIKKDVSNRKHLESQLVHAQKLESIGQLAAGIAHEINTPTQYVGDNTRFLRDSFNELNTLMDLYGKLLKATRNGEVDSEVVTSIESEIEKLDLEFLRDEIPKAIEQSLEGVDRVSEIVRAMKDFSHPGGEEKSVVDLNKAIDSTITVCRNRWRYVADLETEFDASLPPVPCLLGEFNQVILNIVVNAADAIGELQEADSAEKGLITVSTRHDNEWVEIRITDTGGGIPEKIKHRVFDPFFTTKQVGKGTGQGLAISHDVVVNKHGGTIELLTDPGKGSTFIIRLPLVDQPAVELKGAA